MEKGEALEKLAELTARIKELPKGYISKKTIGGKIYYYHQWSENGIKQPHPEVSVYHRDPHFLRNRFHFRLLHFTRDRAQLKQ